MKAMTTATQLALTTHRIFECWETQAILRTQFASASIAQTEMGTLGSELIEMEKAGA